MLPRTLRAVLAVLLAIGLSVALVQPASAEVKIRLSASQKADLAQAKIIMDKAVVEKNGASLLDVTLAYKYAKDAAVDKFIRGWRDAHMGLTHVPQDAKSRLGALKPAECEGVFKMSGFPWGTRTHLTSCQTTTILNYGNAVLYASGFVGGLSVVGKYAMTDARMKLAVATIMSLIALNTYFLGNCAAEGEGVVVYNVVGTAVAWCKSQ